MTVTPPRPSVADRPRRGAVADGHDDAIHLAVIGRRLPQPRTASRAGAIRYCTRRLRRRAGVTLTPILATSAARPRLRLAVEVDEGIDPHDTTPLGRCFRRLRAHVLTAKVLRTRRRERRRSVRRSGSGGVQHGAERASACSWRRDPCTEADDGRARRDDAAGRRSRREEGCGRPWRGVQSPARPSRVSWVRSVCSRAASSPPTLPISVSCTGANPTNPRMLRSSERTEWARYTHR